MPSRRAVLAACGTAALAGCSTLRDEPTITGSWPQRGYDRGRTGSVVGQFDGPEPPLTDGWTRSLPDGRGSETSPILADGTLYVGDTDGPPPGTAGERTVTIDALDPGTGEHRWSATATTTREDRGTYYHADSLAFAREAELVLIQTSNGLCAVGTDGTERWCFDNVGDGQLSYQPVAPAIDDDTAYVGRYRQLATHDIEPVFYAVALADGTERWRHEFSEWRGRLVYSPAVVDDIVYLAEPREGIKALDASDGTELWRESVPVDGAPTVANGAVYVTTADYDTEELGARALETDTGAVRWSVTDDLEDAWAPRHLAVTDETVYYPTFRRLVARDAETGARRWEEIDDQAPVGVGRIGSGAPAVVGDRIYAAGSDVFVIDRSDGSVLGRYETGRDTKSSVAVADGWLYVNTGSTLYGLTTCETEVFGRCLRQG
ncbi:adhesin [Natronococcus pandeyae]|uniref:Adhesin n=1 Tax=Natronococcus pandeyae TaxID=2055836 RepID=A0A8J8Q5K1_9EURY|nr:PQQ-binding-like beta-propeller repeat protein [Natronococcus pandeyae]TYL38039.1 adhesin [Natronococcus pandeyae]